MVDKHVWEQFMDALESSVKSLKLDIDDGSRWVTLRGTNGHRVCIEKARARLPLIESTFGPMALEKDTADLVTNNGRIASRIKPNVIEREGIAFVEQLLELLVDPEMSLAPPRKGTRDRMVPSIDTLLAQAQR